VEVLVPDFHGNRTSLETVLSSRVDVFNHNVETVPRLYPGIRPEADFQRSVRLLSEAKSVDNRVLTKTGLMVGLGEAFTEVVEVFEKLVDVGCDALTVGQYLPPYRDSIPVKEYVYPDVFEEYRRIAVELGFRWVSAGPLVRSSFNAHELIALRNGVSA
jgi:lipoic acid synthetase